MVTVAGQVLLLGASGGQVLRLAVDEEAGILRGSELGVDLGRWGCGSAQVLADGSVMLIDRSGDAPADGGVSLLSLSPPSVEALPHLPCSMRGGGSTVILGRFVVVIGWISDDEDGTASAVCIYDALGRRWSTVKKRGKWPQPGEHPAVVVVDANLYILGSAQYSDCYCISFADLADLIEDDRLFFSLSLAIGAPARLLLERWTLYQWSATCSALRGDASVSTGMGVPPSQFLEPS